MPSITFTGTGEEAYKLYELSQAVTGDESSYRARHALRDRILKAWPELEKLEADEAEEAARRKTLAEESRPIDITPVQQTALAEGFLKVVQDTKRPDGEKDAYLFYAKKCKFSQWLDRQMAKKEIKEFTEADGEAVEADQEAAPAA